jgi:hypothetical protein
VKRLKTQAKNAEWSLLSSAENLGHARQWFASYIRYRKERRTNDAMYIDSALAYAAQHLHRALAHLTSKQPKTPARPSPGWRRRLPNRSQHQSGIAFGEAVARFL